MFTSTHACMYLYVHVHTGKPLSPRSQRLLGGLKGDQYKDIKAEHIPSERERQQAAAKAKTAAENAAGSGGEEVADTAGNIYARTHARTHARTRTIHAHAYTHAYVETYMHIIVS